MPSAHTGSRYARHAPERTLLYALVEAHYPDFIARIEAEGRSLPGYVREAFDAYLRCGVLEHGFLRVVCEHCRAERLVAFSCKKRGFCPSCGARRMAESARHLVEEVFGPRPVRQWVLSFPYPLRFLFASKPEAIGPVLGIVQRVIAGWLADQAGIDRASAQCGAVTLIQRFGSALNLNIHFHMLWLDGVYVEATELPRRELRLHRVRAPTTAQLIQLAATIAHRVCRHLTRKGWLEGEGESAFLADSAAGDDSMDGLRMSSITYRIATGRDAGCKVVTLQTLPGDAGSLEGEAGKVGGFSLHAGVAAEAHESHKLEKLCRYITRPAISEQRLSISPQGRVRYQLKTPWRNGTTHVEWDAVDFIAKLAALVPPPRAHLTRFHGVFAPNANLRAQLTPSGRGKRPAGDAVPVDVSAHDEPRSPEQKRRAMSWAQRLKRVFSIDITTCAHCGGAVRIVASIEEPTAIRAILAHFEKHGALEQAHYRPAARARRPRDEVPATQPAAKPESDPMRPRPRRAALGPVPGFGEKWLRTEPLRGPAMSKTHA
nr:transposase [Pseudomonas asiatica]